MKYIIFFLRRVFLDLQTDTKRIFMITLDFDFKYEERIFLQFLPEALFYVINCKFGNGLVDHEICYVMLL